MTRPDFDPEADGKPDWLEEADLRYEIERGTPYATIEQGGLPFVWWIKVHHGAMVWGPDGGAFLRFGSRAFAERCASSLLLRYWRDDERLDVPRIELRP